VKFFPARGLKDQQFRLANAPQISSLRGSLFTPSLWGTPSNWYRRGYDPLYEILWQRSFFIRASFSGSLSSARRTTLSRPVFPGDVFPKCRDDSSVPGPHSPFFPGCETTMRSSPSTSFRRFYTRLIVSRRLLQRCSIFSFNPNYRFAFEPPLLQQFAEKEFPFVLAVFLSQFSFY